MTRTPFLLLGDGPAEPSGLGRIARDLSSLIVSDPALSQQLDFLQVGGMTPPVWSGWRHVGLDREDDWGARNTAEIYRSVWGDQPGILFGVWDPARLWYHLREDLPVQRWGYCAIDGAGPHERIGGPAQELLQRLDRVLAYGRYGGKVIGKSIGKETGVQWLPHGVSHRTFADPVDAELRAWARQQLGPHALHRLIIGCVMANQPRKDFGVLFGMLAELVARKIPVHLWLHTDVLVKSWSVQQLVEDFGLAKRVSVTGLAGEEVSDRQLASLYQQCQITVLPSLGEGFGYPIVESLAAGMPCVHTQWAEGQGMIPRLAWQVPVREARLEGVYNVARPVTRAEDWANAAIEALGWAAQMDETGQAYLRGCVAHLDWQALWPRWRSWIQQGLKG